MIKCLCIVHYILRTISTQGGELVGRWYNFKWTSSVHKQVGSYGLGCHSGPSNRFQIRKESTEILQ